VTAGAVLCGGSSRRMGTDKAFVELGGVPMAERVAGALVAAGCDPVVFVGGDSVLLARFGRDCHPDLHPDEGPAGGVLTALHALDDDVVVAACDLPLLHAGAVRALVAAASGDVDVVVAAGDRRQPALGWWSRAARPSVEGLWTNGRRSLQELVDGLRAVSVIVDEVALRNVNTPAQLGEAEALLGTLTT
jgi:molybdopterin-guanine dinucleotide biosynthesis protein A